MSRKYLELKNLLCYNFCTGRFSISVLTILYTVVLLSPFKVILFTEGHGFSMSAWNPLAQRNKSQIHKRQAERACIPACFPAKSFERLNTLFSASTNLQTCIAMSQCNEIPVNTCNSMSTQRAQLKSRLFSVTLRQLKNRPEILL